MLLHTRPVCGHRIPTERCRRASRADNALGQRKQHKAAERAERCVQPVLSSRLTNVPGLSQQFKPAALLALTTALLPPPSLAAGALEPATLAALEAGLVGETALSLVVKSALIARFTMSWYPQIERQRRKEPYAKLTAFTDVLCGPMRLVLDQNNGMNTVDKRDPSLYGVDTSCVAMAAVFCAVDWVAISLADAQGDTFPPLLGNALHYAALAQSECLLVAWVLVLLRYVAIL